MKFEEIKSRCEFIKNSIESTGGEVQELMIKPPASMEDIKFVERELKNEIPETFIKVLSEFSSSFSFRWFLPDPYLNQEYTENKPSKFKEIFSGSPNWSLDLLTQHQLVVSDYIKTVCPNPEDPYDAVWHNKFAFCSVENGDYLAIDLDPNEKEKVVYLSHNGGVGHGYKLANNIIELLDNWSRVGFVGCEDFQWIIFTESPNSGINPDSETANEFRNWLNLNL